MHQIQVAIAGLLILALAGCAAPVVAPMTDSNASDTQAAERLRIVATVSPITNVVYNIAGARAEIVGIVPEGVNSHTYEPAPSDARRLAAADLIFINGLKLEEPTLKLAEANAKDGAEIVLLGDQTIAPDEYLYDFSFPEEAGSPNPHLWPNPFLTLKYAEIIRNKLSERDPEHADEYAANYARFEERIQALDVAIKATVASIPEENRKLLTYHDSWAYFAPLYGMTVIGAIQPSDFAEPSARELVELIEQLKAEQAPAIFGSEVFPSPILEQIARESGADYVDDLRDDDLPGQPGDDNHSYFGLMAENLRIMAEALGGDPSIMAAFDTRNVPGADRGVEQSQ
ncbi:MAG: metal ABC transporter substrate-binding protein [Caldilinea sp.]